MDNPMHPDPSQEIASPPEEKLLRAPTFWEKYGKLVTWLIILVLVGVSAISGWIIFAASQTPTPHGPVSTITPVQSISPSVSELGPTVFDGIAPDEDASASPVASPTAQVACSLEVKVCADGSYVGRSGPTCEFTPCPQ